MIGLGVAWVILGLAFALGPVRFPVRAALRQAGPGPAKRYEQPVAFGLLLGAVAAAALAPAWQISPLMIAALVLLALLAAADAAWRWLPPVWTGLLALLGLMHLTTLDAPLLRLIEAGAVMAFLLGLRQIFWRLRGEEALGLGDIWLSGTLALLLGAALTSQVLGLAAASGLLGFMLATWFCPPKQRRLGVAFGTHICFISAIYLTWFTTGPLSAYT